MALENIKIKIQNVYLEIVNEIKYLSVIIHLSVTKI